MRGLFRLTLCCSLLLACQKEPLDVAPVELARMQGKWFEIAKLPRPSQAGCFGTTAEYQLHSASELLVVNECRQGSHDGPLQRVSARAVVDDPEVPAKLSLDFGFAFGDYWIIEVIGHPTRDYLWILSREKTLPSDELDAIVTRAKARGFPVGILSYTEQ
jgi:apolipoprotein D and lipocalin family protein